LHILLGKRGKPLPNTVARLIRAVMEIEGLSDPIRRFARWKEALRAYDGIAPSANPNGTL
jgi:hypothetical protein